MKVLITGGYGFIGSFVGEVFHKEGFEVYIIDNLSNGNKNNVKFEHKFFLLSIEDPKCEEVFKSITFDIVIHLAAQINVNISMENPLLDTKQNVLGLSNILHLANKYGVKKVVFASSAAVYGMNEDIPLTENSLCDPISLYGINKLIGEMYCKKWKEIYGLETLIFRFSNVYGPRQGTVGEGGVISTFIQQCLDGEEITIHGDGKQTRDFIYVEDVAITIYQSAAQNLSGLYNLSTNKEVSINQLVDALRKIDNVKSIKYEKERKGDIKYSRLDNKNLKKDLNWEPKYSYQEGLLKTFEWFSSLTR